MDGQPKDIVLAHNITRINHEDRKGIRVAVRPDNTIALSVWDCNGGSEVHLSLDQAVWLRTMLEEGIVAITQDTIGDIPF